MKKKTPSCSTHAILLVLFQFLTLITKMASAQTLPISVKVGVVLDEDDYVGKMGLHCISMAISDFYAKESDYKTRIVVESRDSKRDVIGAAAAAVDLVKNVEVQAIIGPLFSDQATFLIAIGDKAQVPIITFSATRPFLSSIRTPYFVRATLDDSSQVQAIGAFIQAYGWRQVVPIYEDSEFGEGIIPFLADALEQVNARVPYRSVIPSKATDDRIVAELYKLMTMQTRVFVVQMLTPLGSRLFAKAMQLGMMSEDYVWIITDGMSNELNSMDPSILGSMVGVIGVQPYIPKTKELDDFTTQYKGRTQLNNSAAIGLDLNIFGLWAYDSTIALALAAEEAILTNPKFREAKVSKNSTELEAFGVSYDGPKLVRALSRTTFSGLAGKFQLVDGQLQPPPYQIVNVVSSGIQVIGYWTKENGIVRDLSFPNANTNTNSTPRSNFGPTTWTGNKNHPPKGWVIPTNGEKLKIGVPVKTGYTQFVSVTWNADNSTKVEGFSTDVFDAAMEALPYHVPYKYIPFATSDHKKAGTYDDLIYQVYLGNFDAVAGDVTIRANRSQYVDFTLPYLESRVSMVVPIKEDKSRTGWVFVKPLTWELWLASFCSFVFIGFLIWILEHRVNEDFRGPPSHQVGMIFWFAFATVVFANKERVISNLARFVLIVWFLVVLILTQSYTASLASMLTVQKLKPTISDVEVLIETNDKVGYMEGSFVFGLLKRMGFNESRLVPFHSPEEMDKLLSNGSGNGGIAAAFHEIPYIKLFLFKYCSKYIMVDVPTNKADGFGFVFPSGSPLVPDVSRAILQVTESEKMTEIERKWLGYKTKCPENTLDSPKNLGLKSFWGLFLIVGIVGTSALIIYVIMFLYENWHGIHRSDPESTKWSKMTELLRRFDNRDLTCHTFKKTILTDRDGDRDNGSGVDCRDRAMSSSPANYRQSPSIFSLSSPRTDGPPSPIFSSPNLQNTIFQRGQESSIDDKSITFSIPTDQKRNFQGEQGGSVENAMTDPEGEDSQKVKREIELANLNEYDQITSTSAQGIC